MADTSAVATGQAWEQHDLDAELDALFNRQGALSEHDYLRLTNHTNRLVELVDEQIEALAMPTTSHQAILRYLFLAFLSLTQRTGGQVFFAPLRLQIRPGTYREPDLLLLRAAADPRLGEAYWTGADLVVEIVSPSPKDRRRDYEDKRSDYAYAGIAEYWIVDPQRESITVLRLAGAGYIEHGVFGRGAWAPSALFPDFTVSVDAVLDACSV